MTFAANRESTKLEFEYEYAESNKQFEEPVITNLLLIALIRIRRRGRPHVYT